MNTILAVSLISFKEGLRQRLLYGVMIFALLVMAFAVLISGLFMRDISKIILDFCLSAVNIGGLLVPFFLAINLLSRDIERKTVYSILSRSISRSQYIIGKFVGLCLLSGSVMLILACAAAVSVYIGKFVYGADFFEEFSFFSVLVSIFMSYIGLLMLNALVVLWCTLTTSSFLATLLALFTYVIGHTIDDVVRFIAVEIEGVEISQSVHFTVNVAKYLFPNLSAFDFKLQAAHGLPIPAGDIAFLIVYAAAYTSVVLALSVMVFSRRDLS